METPADQQQSSSAVAEDPIRLVDGRFEVTPAGIARYKTRFAQAGFDITKIRTLDEFEAALVGSYHIESDAAEMRVFQKKYKNALEAELLRAVIRGDEAEEARISGLLHRRDLLGLRVITGGTSCEAPR